MAANCNNRMPQPRFCFEWNGEKVMRFLNSLDSKKIELKILIHKRTMLLVLLGSYRVHEIGYLDILHLKGDLKPPMKYLNFNSNKNMCLCYHINQ